MCNYVCLKWSFKYKIQYKIHYFSLGSLRDTLCRFAKANSDVTTQLSIIITGLLNPNFACNVSKYFKDRGPKSNCQSQNAICGTQSDIYPMPKTVSPSMRIELRYIKYELGRGFKHI